MITIPSAYLSLLTQLAAICDTAGLPAYLAGGTPRDLLLGRAVHDIDLTVDGDGLTLARQVADALGGAFVPLDRQRGTGRAVLDGALLGTDGPLVVDVASLRAPTVEDDLLLRDFTVNALAAPLAGLLRGDSALPLLDPCGGMADLEARVLRPCTKSVFADDPARMLRLVRLAAVLGFALDPLAEGLLRRAAPQIGRVSAERVRDELLQLLDSRGGAWGLRLLDDARVLTRIFPELEPARNCDQPNVHVMPVLPHSLEAVAAMEWLLLRLGVGGPTPEIPAPYEPWPQAVQQYPELAIALPHATQLRSELEGTMVGGHRRLALLKLATLLHDNAKPQTKAPKEGGGVSFHDHQGIGSQVAATICQRLRLSRQETGYVALVVKEHMRPGQLQQIPELTLRAVQRFFRDCNGYGPDVLLHSLADHFATRGPLTSPDGWRAHVAWVGSLLESYWNDDEVPAPLLDGRVLMQQLGLAAGPLVGQLLDAVREAQLAGEIASAEQALAVARAELTRRR